MAFTYSRNSNLLSSKNVSFNKKVAPEQSSATSDKKLSDKQDALKKQLEIQVVFLVLTFNCFVFRN